MFISIHQPDYLPWMGYLNKIKTCEKFILLDTASYSRDGVHHRNRIKVAEGKWSYLTIPVPRSEKFKPMCNVALPEDTAWADAHWRTIEHHYRRAAHWNDFADFFRQFYEEKAKKFTTLADLNTYIIEELARLFGLVAPCIRASSLNLSDLKGSEQILAICKQTGATKYLSGGSGRKYLDLDSFAQEGIEVIFQSYHQEPYRQLFGDYVPGLSAIDLLLNEGKEGARFL